MGIWKDGSNRTSKSLPALLLAVPLLLSAGPLSAQGTVTGTILGTVRDETGAIIPRAQITVINIATGLRRDAVTGDTGDYVVPFLPVGEYMVVAEMTGFRKEVRRGITLQIDQRVRVDFVLKVGEVVEEINVYEQASLLKTDSSDIGELVEHKRVVELPLNGRQFIQLALLTAGATPMPEGIFSGPFAIAGGSPNVNGNRADANNYLLDGVSINDTTFHHLSVSPSVDAVQEFKVQSSLYSAEFGSSGGAQVNVAIKSGTNEFHGTLWEFLRNDVLDARNFFDAEQPPPFRQNQFGFTSGGPLARDRSFFFASYEGLRIRKGITIPSVVPSEDMRRGDFRSLAPIFDPLTFDPRTGSIQQFPNNVIPPERISPVARALLERVPLPNRPAAVRNFVGFGKRRNNSDQFNIRIDQNFSSNDTFAARFTFSNILNTEPIPGAASFQTGSAPLRPPGFGHTTKLRNRNLALQHTHIFRPNLLNQFRFGYNYTRSRQLPENPVDFIGANGILGTNRGDIGLGVPVFSIVGFSLLGDNGFDLNWRNHTFSYIDDLSYSRGTHSIKAGISIDRIQANPQFLLIPRGQFNFRNQFTANPRDPLRTGHAFADFLLGLPFTALAGVGDTQAYYRGTRWAFYVQDDWKARPNLTFNIGVRYELATPLVEKFDRLSNLDIETGNFVLSSRNSKTNPAARTGDFRTLTFVTSEQARFPRALIDGDFNNWAPRFGLAYSFGDRKTVIRAGFGIFYSRGGFSPISIVGGLTFNPPFFGSRFFSNTSLTNLVEVRSALVAPGITLPAPQVRVRDKALGYTQQWSLNIQREITSSLLIEAIYLGSRGNKLDEVVQMNQAVPGPGPLSGRVRWPFLATTLSVGGPFGWSTYHSFTLQARQRLSRGLAFNANYTISKSLDTISLGLSTNANANRPQNSHDVGADYGPSVFDIRHRLVLNYSYDLPMGPGKRFANISGAAGRLLGGWQLAGIVVVQGGTPFSPLVPFDRSGTGGFQDRPDQIADPNKVDKRTPERFFNTSAFQLQPAGRFGNAGRNTIRGPGFATFDLSLIKNTSIDERHVLQFRAEFFNLFNRVNFNLPNRTFGTPDFGVVFSAKDAREIQFALKYIF